MADRKPDKHLERQATWDRVRIVHGNVLPLVLFLKESQTCMSRWKLGSMVSKWVTPIY